LGSLATNPELAPLLDVVEYEEVDFVNPFAHKTIYRGPPTDELEEAWKELWYFGSVSIPEDKMPLLNRSTQTQAFKPDASGSGYHALIEMFHQLHCLVSLPWSKTNSLL